MKNIKKLASAMAALCLAATSGCSAAIGSGTQNALTVDGYDIPAGIFVYYTIQGYDSAVSVLSEQNDGTPTIKDVKNAHIDEKDAADWIQEQATNDCVTFAAVQRKFDEVGAELTEEDYDDIDYMAEYYYSDDARNDQNGISLESIRAIAEASYKQRAIFSHYYGIGGEKGVTDEEMKDYFDENFARIKYFSISLTDDEGNLVSEDDQRELRKKAEDYAKQINKKSGDLDKMWELDSASEDYSEYVAAQTTAAEDDESVETTTTAAEETEDTTTETTTTDPYANERLYQRNTTAAETESEDTETTASDTNTAYNDFNDFIFNELELNKAAVYDYDDETIYVVIRGDLRERMTEDDYWSEDYIDQLLQMRYFEEYSDFIEDYAAGLTVNKNSSAYRRYAPFKLVLEEE